MTTITAGAAAVPVEKIYVPANIRELDPEHVAALTGSIGLQGQLTPVNLIPATGVAAEQGYEYELVAGFHRYEAIAVNLRQATIEGVIAELDAEAVNGQGAATAAARAAENVVRKQLTADEEALAVKAMLAGGLTEEGAAHALGWPKARITARLKLLELPELAQKMVGDGRIPLSAVDLLRSIGAVSEPVLGVVLSAIASERFDAREFARRPGRVTAQALRENSGVFGALLTDLDHYAIEQLKLGKKATEQYEELSELTNKLDPYAYGRPRVPFSDEDADQARAAGVLIEFDGDRPIIVDRSLYRELAKQAITRHLQEQTERAAERAAEKKAAKAAALASPVDPLVEAKREYAREIRALSERAHSVNTDLGWALRNGLAAVDPADMNVARFFVYALLEADTESGYGGFGERARDLAARGIRLVIEEFRTDVTKTKKDGSRGALRIDYGEPDAAREWFWKYLDGAKTAGELYGRALVVLAAEKYALRLVLPAAQQQRPLAWHSHKNRAEKAVAKLAGPHLPASLRQLERAIAKAKAAYQERQREVWKAADPARSTPAETDRDDNVARFDEQPGGAALEGLESDDSGFADVAQAA